MGKASAVRLHWPVELLREQLAPLLPGVVVEAVAEIDSTNSELMRRARAGRTAPTLLVAELQTAGRGRLGRGWQSGDGERGGALAFSLGLPLVPCDWSGLSLAVGLAVAESLHPDIRLKWPNDLWWQGRKLAGILVETAGTGQPGTGRYAVIGIGVNIAPLPGEGFITNLQSADRGDLIGYTFSAADLGAAGGLESALFTASAQRVAHHLEIR